MSTKWESVAVGVASSALLSCLANRSVSGGDSGELLAACREFGVAHPPGYPLWVGICWGFDRFDAAWLLSPLCGGGTCGALYAATKKITSSPSAAFVTICSLMCSQSFILYSCTAEVFSLNNFLCSVLLLLAVHYFEQSGIRLSVPAVPVVPVVPATHKTDKKKDIKETSEKMNLTNDDWAILWSAVYSALALANQQTSILYIVPAAVVVVPHFLYYGKNSGVVITMSVAIFVSLFCFLYLTLMLSSRLVYSPNSWGSAFDMYGLLVHMLRLEYGTFSLANSKAAYAKTNFLQSLSSWALFNLQQLGPVMLLLAVVGGVRVLFSGRSKVVILMMMLVCFYMVFFAYLGNIPLDTELFQSVQERFWLQPLLIMSILTGYGFHTLTPQFLNGFAGVGLSLSYLSSMYVNNWSYYDQSNNILVEQFAKELLRPLKPGSLLFTKGDIITNSVRYAQTVKHFRTDVIAVDLELLRSTWYVPRLRFYYGDRVVFPGRSYNPSKNGFSAKQLIDANINNKNGGLYVAYDFVAGDKKWKDSYQLVSTGIADQIVSKKSDASQVISDEEWTPSPMETTIKSLVRYEPWDEVVINDYWASLYRRSQHIVHFKQKHSQATPILEHLLTAGVATAKPLIQVVSSRLLVTCFATIVTESQTRREEVSHAVLSRTVAAMDKFIALASDYFPERYGEEISAMKNQRKQLLNSLNN